MANSLKEHNDGLALQITREARAAGLAETKNEDGLEGAERWSRLAPVRIYVFDGLVLVADRERVSMDKIAEIVKSAVGDTETMYHAARGQITPSGNGCMVSLPGVTESGMDKGDTVAVETASGLLVLHDGESERLARDLRSIREVQLGMGVETDA